MVRRRLLDRLDAIPEYPLTVLVGPAGYGKTTLLASWLRGIDSSVAKIAWLSLDAEDDYLERLLIYLCEAIDAVFPDSMSKVRYILDGAQTTPLETTATVCLNAIAQLPGPLTLVVDDFHLIRARPVLDLFTVLVERAPPDFHLVLATRAEPALPIHRLRARALVNEIGQSELAFSNGEAAEFLNQLERLGLSELELAQVLERTEGWSAGLQLAALSIRQGDGKRLFEKAAANEGPLFEYFAEEILRSETPVTRDFLARTAWLDAVTPDLATALTGVKDAARLLDDLATRNLFVVRLAGPEPWFRYHHLFSDFLKSLRSGLGIDVAQVHRDASRWHEGRSEIPEAVAHSIHAGDFMRAADLADAVAINFIAQGRLARVLAWADQMPDEVPGNAPGILVARATRALINRDFSRAAEIRRRIDAILEAADNAGRPYSGAVVVRAMCLGMASFSESYLGDPVVGLSIAERARAMVSIQPGFVSGFLDLSHGLALLCCSRFDESRDVLRRAMAMSSSPFVVGLAVDALARIATLTGRMQEGRALAESALERARQAGLEDVPAMASAHNYIAMAALESGDTSTALIHADRAADLAMDSEFPVYLLWARANQLGIAQAQGNLAAAEAAASRLMTQAHSIGIPQLIARASALRVRMLLAFGEVDAAATEAARGMPAFNEVASAAPKLRRPWMDTFAYVVLKSWIHLKLALGQGDQVEGLIQSWIDWSQSNGLRAEEMEGRTYAAMAAAQSGRSVTAMQEIGRALWLGEQCAYVRTFVDCGPGLLKLLTAYRRRRNQSRPGDPSAAYVDRVIAAFPGMLWAAAVPPGAAERTRGLPDPLTDREREILALVATGATNRDLASRFVVTEATIKTHINNLYRKLDVRTRTQAIARARELGLL